jgi:hypothetical protein
MCIAVTYLNTMMLVRHQIEQLQEIVEQLVTSKHYTEAQ